MTVTRFDLTMHTADPADSRTVAIGGRQNLTLEQAGALHDAVCEAVRVVVGAWVPPNEFAATSDDADLDIRTE